MRTHTDDLAEVLAGGSYSTRLIVDAFDGRERTAFDLGTSEWELRWDSEAKLKSAGSVKIVDGTDLGTSLSPSATRDPLAPFGQELNLLMEVSAGEFSETLQLGHYRIASVPAAKDARATFRDREIVTASAVDLVLEDRLSFVARNGFESEINPATTSAWGELATITGMQIIRSVSDVTLPVDYVYQAVRDGRLKAVKDIALRLGGTEYTTPDGALSVRPFAAGSAVGALTIGEDGTILGDSGGLDSEFANIVIGDFETVDRIPIRARAEATGDLAPAVTQPSTYYHSNPAIVTQVDADAEVAAELAKRSRPAKRITVDSLIDPRIEDGDVLDVTRPDGTIVTARVVAHHFTSNRRMTTDLDVI